MNFSVLKHENSDDVSDKRINKIRKQVDELLKKKQRGEKLDENQSDKLNKYTWMYEKKNKDKYYIANPNRKTKRQINKEKRNENMNKRNIKVKLSKDKEKYKKIQETIRQEKKRIEEEENKKRQENKKRKRQEEEERERDYKKKDTTTTNIIKNLRILELYNTTDYTIITKQYKKLCLKHHPDKGGDKVNFQQINNAHEELKLIFYKD